MIDDGTPATSIELLRVDQILSQIAKDMEIHFQLHGEKMKRPEAVEHFTKRKALEIVRGLVLDKGETLNALNG